MTTRTTPSETGETDSFPERLNIVNARELSDILTKVGVHMSEKVVRNNMAAGHIKAVKQVNPINGRTTYDIPAEEVDRILQLYGKRWPRDPEGNGIFDPVGYLQRKGKPNIVKEGEHS